MTTKRKAQGTTTGKAEAGRTPEELMVVPSEDAEQLVAQIADAVGGDTLYSDDEAVGPFLLLLHSMTYCPANQREFYLFAAQRVLLPCTRAFARAADAIVEDAACTFKKAALEGGKGARDA